MKTFDPSLVHARMVIDSARFNRNYARFRETERNLARIVAEDIVT